MAKVTPWEVQIKDESDYQRLIEIFGVKPIDEKLKEKLKEYTKELHPLIERNIFYAHRDLDLVLKDYEEGRGFFLYTGIAPSKGKMHIGHLVPFILTRWFQEKFDVNVYIMFPDEEKYWAKKVDDYKEVRRKIKEMHAKYIAALGFDPDKTFMFINSEYIKHLYSAAIPIARHINLSQARAVFGFNDSTSVGLVFYTVLQIVPTFFENKRPLIPAGIDQDPYFRLQRDIAPKLNKYKAAEILSKMIWGLRGPYTKMSSSDPDSAIFLDDSYEEVKRKIMKAFSGGQPTLELHRKYGGNPDIDVVFFWLKALFEEDTKKLKELEQSYREGTLTTGELKQYAIEKIWRFLKDLQEKAKKVDINKYFYDGKLAKQMWEWEL
ncbi:NEQ115 [Nanoarchaeum equitans Kin4-M]|uniref:Tryptophan--tRNA ligase n=1 Tax=Nanoarchaeum equitans (strain Kin4-M) TaxID=228908 RepID=Q74MK6_NANEQ|nr:NEQ115 [Nanoarchaeum equitans Kin4-M]